MHTQSGPTPKQEARSHASAKLHVAPLRLFVFAALITLFPAEAYAQLSLPPLKLEEYRSLFDTAEALHNYNLKRTVSREEHREILTMSCGVLMRLTDDQNFKDLLNAYEAVQHDDSTANSVQNIFLRFQLFLNLLAEEQRALVQEAGLSEGAADEILANLLRARTLSDNFKPSR